VSNIKIYIISIIAFFFGVLFFAIYNKWVIFSFPSYVSKVASQAACMKPEKKEINLFYWYNKKWNKEKVSLLLSEDKSKSIKYIVNSWLNLLEEEAIMKDRVVTLQTALVSSSGACAYLSFDRNPLDKESSTYNKLMWLEGLLKTLRENNIDIQNIYFLVHHEIMQDYHLDFSNPWPIYGFLDGAFG